MMRLKAATALLAPLLLLQGRRVKRRIIRLQEATGTRQYNLGQGLPLRILIIGDSAAAGVGVRDQANALLGQLTKQLQHYYLLDIQLKATSGDCSQDLMHKLQDYPQTHYDVIITSIGVNDVTQRQSPSAWSRLQKQLFALIEQKFQPQLVLITAVPPMHLFEALPQPLRWYLGQYATAYNQTLKQLLTSYSNFQLIAWDATQTSQQFLAEDGFHPNEHAYTLWAQQLAMVIQQHF